MDRYDKLKERLGRIKDLDPRTLEKLVKAAMGEAYSRKSEAERFIKENIQALLEFAGDSSLTFGYSPNIEAPTFYPRTGRIDLPLSWFDNEQYTNSELLWAVHHEVGHFIDMRKNPQAFFDKYDHLEQLADELTDEYQDRFLGTSTDELNSYFYEQVRGLYNYLDDIYVNDLVSMRVKKYQSGDGRYDVINMYRKAGFAEPDLRYNDNGEPEPEHKQLVKSLLRDAMVGDQLGLSQVSERVETELSKKKFGFTIREIVNYALRLNSEDLVDPALRYKIIKTLIEPTYIELLKSGLESCLESNDWSFGESQNDREKQNNKTGQRSQSSNSQRDFNPFGEGSPDLEQLDFLESIDESTIQEMLEYFTEYLKEESDMNDKTAAERRQHQNKKIQEDFDRRHDITPSTREEFEILSEEVKSDRAQMRDFWKQLIKGSSVAYSTIKTSGHLMGKLDVKQVVDQYGQIIEYERKGNLNKMPIYNRQEIQKSTIEQTESIEITLLIDVSSSMDDEDKLMAAKKSTVLLMQSIKDFNNYLEQSRRETNSRLRANTQVIIYNEDFKEVKPFEKTTSIENNEANIIKTVSHIVPSGWNDEEKPLSFISDGISTNQLEAIYNQKLKKVIFLITDGGSSDPDRVNELVKELSDKGVLSFAFQIGDVSSGEIIRFNKAWNSGHSTKLGIRLNNNIGRLPVELMKTLTRVIKDIKI